MKIIDRIIDKIRKKAYIKNPFNLRNIKIEVKTKEKIMAAESKNIKILRVLICRTLKENT